MQATSENSFLANSVSTAHTTRPLHLDLGRKTIKLCQSRMLKCKSHLSPVVLLLLSNQLRHCLGQDQHAKK